MQSAPYIDAADRVVVEEIGPKFWRATARYGFMQRPDIPRLLVDIQAIDQKIDLSDVTYYVGIETVVPREDGRGLPHWQELLFAIMARNAAHVTDFFRLP